MDDFVCGQGKCPKCGSTTSLTDRHVCHISDEEYNKKIKIQDLSSTIRNKEIELEYLKELLKILEEKK